MSTKRVLLCQDIHEAGRQILRGKVETVIAPDPSEEKVRAIIPDFHGVIVRTATTLGQETIEAAAKLEVIGRTGAGVDNVDINTAARKGIPVCYTPEANTSSVVEHTLSLILALAKHLPVMDQAVRQGHFKIRYEYRPVDVAGKNIGVIGLGKIGLEVAQRSLAMLKMKVIAYDPYLNHRDTALEIEITSDLAALFERADFITVHVPYTKETHHLINRDLLSRMKTSAYLINTSRGAIVDESALSAALSRGKIAGAGLDVYEQEPPSPDNPLLRLSNIILTPHSAALTKECVARMAMDAAQGVLDVLEGRKPKYVFNAGVFKQDPGL